MTVAHRVAALVCALALGLAGCTETPTVTRADLPPAGSSPAGPSPAGPSAAGPTTSAAPTSAPSSTEDLAALKQAAKIEDCPVSDPDVAAVPTGLPDVTLQCLGGGRDVRLAGLRGRPMMINVWAQWCAPCRQEAPFLADVATVNRSDLMILGIDFQDPDPARAITFAQVASWRYPQLEDTDLAIRAPLQVTGLPQTFFVRADGTIAHRQFLPFTSADQIRTLAREHLGVSP